MIRKLLLSVSLVVFGFLMGLQIPARAVESDAISSASFSISMSVLRIEALHRLLIGHAGSLEESLAASIAIDLALLSESDARSDLSDSEEMRLEKLLVLAAVMDEKLGIEQWHSDSNLQKILQGAVKSNSKLAKSLRCKDWSQPMWVSDECA